MKLISKRFMKVALSLAAVLMLLTSTACSSSQSATSATNAQDLEAKELQTPVVPGAETASQERPKLEGKATVVMEVNGKSITMELDGNHAPITAGNFIDLVKRGVYDGTRFHRVVTTPQPFVAQGGDPKSKDPAVPNGSLGAGNFVDPTTNRDRFIPLEITPEGAGEPVYSQTLKAAGVNKAPQLRHTKGAVAMARTPLPDSASAQFYFALDELQFLDGDYAVFGYVTEGMDVVEGIKQGDVITSAKVTSGAENLK